MARQDRAGQGTRSGQGVRSRHCVVVTVQCQVTAGCRATGECGNVRSQRSPGHEVTKEHQVINRFEITDIQDPDMISQIIRITNTFANH